MHATPNPSATVIVYERQPYWGPELKRRFSDQAIRVHECRSVSDLIPAIHNCRVCVVLMVLDTDPAECLQWFQSHSGDTASHCVIIASADLQDLEWSLREAGAIGFVSDEISGDRLSRLCLRQLRIAQAIV